MKESASYRICGDLIDAAGSLDEKKVDSILAAHPEAIGWGYVWGGTALHFLSMEGPEESVQLLIDRGADVNCRDDFGDTPLLTACLPGKEGMIKLLLENGADPNIPNDLMDYPLQKAAERGEYEIARLLLEHGARVDIVSEIRNEFGEGETIFCFLPEDSESREAMMLLLLQHGADPNCQSALIDYPLLEAVRECDVKLIRALIRHGARTDICSRENETVFDLLPEDEDTRIQILEILRSG